MTLTRRHNHHAEKIGEEGVANPPADYIRLPAAVGVSGAPRCRSAWRSMTADLRRGTKSLFDANFAMTLGTITLCNVLGGYRRCLLM
jgi:hypothetical protein